MKQSKHMLIHNIWPKGKPFVGLITHKCQKRNYDVFKIILHNCIHDT